MLPPTKRDGLLASREPLFPLLQRGLTAAVDRVAATMHVDKHVRKATETSRVTHERPFIDGSTTLGGVTVGLTISELHAIRAREGVEFIQVVDLEGNSNL